MITASPGCSFWFWRWSACSRSPTVISYVSGSMSTPLSAATSISTPRLISVPTFSMPTLVKPVRVAMSSSLKQL